MQVRMTANEYRTTVVCVDSYRDNILHGRLFNPYLHGAAPFDSLMQWILRMEELLDEMRFPQPFSESRAFAPVTFPPLEVAADLNAQKGELATFAVKVLFRQNASWQGSVTWLEGGREESFRSTLELLLLMHSALVSGEKK